MQDKQRAMCVWRFVLYDKKLIQFANGNNVAGGQLVFG